MASSSSPLQDSNPESKQAVHNDIIVCSPSDFPDARRGCSLNYIISLSTRLLTEFSEEGYLYQLQVSNVIYTEALTYF